MPVYEYRCSECKKIFRKLVRPTELDKIPVCTLCGAENARRVMSRFVRMRGEEEALDDLASKMDGVNENDPRVMRDVVRELGDEMGEDFTEEEMAELMSPEDPSGPPVYDLDSTE